MPPRGSCLGPTNRVDGDPDQPYFMYRFLGGTKDERCSGYCMGLGRIGGSPASPLAEIRKRQSWLAAERGGYREVMASTTKGSKKSKDPENSSVVTTLGESALTGLPGKIGGAVAKPVSKRTKWSEQQIRTAIGLALLAWALYRVLRPTVRAVRSR